VARRCSWYDNTSGGFGARRRNDPGFPAHGMTGVASRSAVLLHASRRRPREAKRSVVLCPIRT